MNTYLLGCDAIGAAGKPVKAGVPLVTKATVQQKPLVAQATKAPTPAPMPIAAPQVVPVQAQPQASKQPEIAQIEKELFAAPIAAPSIAPAPMIAKAPVGVPAGSKASAAPIASPKSTPISAQKPTANFDKVKVQASVDRASKSGKRALDSGKKLLKRAKSGAAKQVAQAAIDAGNKSTAASAKLKKSAASVSGSIVDRIFGELLGNIPQPPQQGGPPGMAQDVTALILEAQADADAAAAAADAAAAAADGQEAPGSTISPGNPAVRVNNTLQLTAITPQGLKVGGWMWESSDPNTASVDDVGKVTGVAPGTATITATNHTLTATATVTVSAGAVPAGSNQGTPQQTTQTAPTISPPSAQIPIGGQQRFSVLTGSTPATGVWTWGSSNPNAVSIDSSGNAYGLAAGFAMVTATQGSVVLNAGLTVYDQSQQGGYGGGGGYGGDSGGGGSSPDDGSGGGQDDSLPPPPASGSVDDYGPQQDDSGGYAQPQGDDGSVADGMTVDDLLQLVESLQPQLQDDQPTDDQPSETDDSSDSQSDDSQRDTMLGTYMLGVDFLGVSYSPAPSLDAVRAGTSVIGKGVKGDAVTYVQRALAAPVDSEYGPTTEGVVKAFQAFKGLSASGAVDKATLAAIDAVVNAGGGLPSSAVVPVASKAPATITTSEQAPASFWSRPLWDGAPVKGWQGLVGGGGLLLLGTGIAVAARGR